ncbi:Uncharacterised protein [Bacteroides uniformis]|uniref:Uncharacterized protein n=1 Tax=Bacteroides uniformis TaxID=820 RepID=A0A174EEJ0_BACUN|nr:Uncharacterised protein [Bacteroides uniformis]
MEILFGFQFYSKCNYLYWIYYMNTDYLLFN